MFSWITRWFHKSDKDKKKDEQPEKSDAYQKGDPIPYSLEFSGADRVIVNKSDCQRDNVVGVEQNILDAQVIMEITRLLEMFPDEGERPHEIDHCQEYVITAYKGEVPFAHVHMYDGLVMLPNKLFIGPDERLELAQNQLFKEIEIK